MRIKVGYARLKMEIKLICSVMLILKGFQGKGFI